MKKSEKINLLKNNENVCTNSIKISLKQQEHPNITLSANKMKRTTYLNYIKIFFHFKNKKKNEIGFEDDNYEEKNKNLIHILKVKINKAVKNETSNIGCGGFHSYIRDNSFFNFFIFLKINKKNHYFYLAIIIIINLELKKEEM
jgi:hypothetical protein